MSETRIRLNGFINPFLVGPHLNLAVTILQFCRQRDVDKEDSPREKGKMLSLGLRTEDLIVYVLLGRYIL